MQYCNIKSNKGDKKMDKKYLMSNESLENSSRFEIEDHESTASGAAFFAFFFYFNNYKR